MFVPVSGQSEAALSLGQPIDNSIVRRIAAQAASIPDQTAVCDELAALTFAELDARSSRLAARLAETGLGPAKCVGLFFERSVDFVVAALAVWKAGGAYLPLDSATPPDRAAAILDDADAPLVLTHRGKTRDWARNAWLVIETDRDEAPAGLLSEPTSPDPDALAYVIYTSGSTGEPKGVEITHANLLNLIDWHQRTFCVTNADRASQVAGLGFDATVWELWPHLSAGATVYFAGELQRRSSQGLRDWLVARQVTIAFVPTVLAEQLLHITWPAETRLRTLLTGADVLYRRPMASVPFVVVNNYGPTECTVVATSGVVSPEGVSSASGRPSIGRPIDQASALLLDDQLRPVADGEAGELCLAGALVGRGYRNHPQLTEARFVTYRPENGPAQRIYRTGDRARWLPSGELAFLGRLDEQLKIRGYRIEPGEIVALLDRFPAIEACAVKALEAAGGPQLVAYVVTSNETISAAELREYLAQHLPDYMLPVQFVRLTSLPLTVNGKLDREALPEPSAENLLHARPATGTHAEGCQSSLESALAALVATLVGLPKVAPADNFFLLCGHSMLAAQLMARINDEFGVRIGFRQLFQAPTVRDLASEVERLQGQARG